MQSEELLKKMRIVQYLPDSPKGMLAGIEDVLRIVEGDFSKITITKEKLTEKDYIEIFGISGLSERLSAIAKYIIEVK